MVTCVSVTYKKALDSKLFSKLDSFHRTSFNTFSSCQYSMRHDSILVIAIDANTLVGMCIISYDDASGYPLVHNLCTDPNIRNKGIASKILAHCNKLHECIHLSVMRTKVKTLLPFYIEKNNFVAIPEYDEYDRIRLFRKRQYVPNKYLIEY